MKKILGGIAVLLLAATLLSAGGRSMSYFPNPGTYDMGSWPLETYQYQIASDQTNVYLTPYTRDSKFTIESYTVGQQDSAMTLLPPVLPIEVSDSCKAGTNCTNRAEFSPVCTITPTTPVGTYALQFTIITSAGNLSYTDTCEVVQ